MIVRWVACAACLVVIGAASLAQGATPTTAGETAFDAITDVIHRLLALIPHHSLPKVIQT